MSVERQNRIAELRTELNKLLVEEAQEALAGAPADLLSRVGALLDAKLPIEAIKLYRGEKGTTLREAKDVVDAYAAKRRET